MKICAVVCTVLIKIRWIIASKLCGSSWLPVISQKTKQTSDWNYVRTLWFLFTSLTVVFRLHVMFQKKYFEYTEMEGHKQPLRRARPPGPPKRRHWLGSRDVVHVVKNFQHLKINWWIVQNFVGVTTLQKTALQLFFPFQYIWTTDTYSKLV